MLFAGSVATSKALIQHQCFHGSNALYAGPLSSPTNKTRYLH